MEQNIKTWIHQVRRGKHLTIFSLKWAAFGFREKKTEAASRRDVDV